MSNEGARLPSPLSFSDNVVEKFKRFKQQFEIYLMASGKANKSSEVKVALLLNAIGEEGIEIFNNFELEEDEKKDYEKVIKEFEVYVNPGKNLLYERFKFYTRNRQEKEPFDNFVQELKTLIKNCEYGETADEILRDRIVLGINENKLQQRLLQLKDISLKEVLRTCRNYEMLEKQVRVIQQEEKKVVLNKQVQQKQEMKKKKFNRISNRSCSKCKREHQYGQCPAYGSRCKKCGKYNHWAIGCKTGIFKKKIRVVEGNEDNEEEAVNHVVKIETISDKKQVERKKDWIKEVKICGKNIKFKLDSGAEVNILPLNILKQVDKNAVLTGTKMLLQAYGGAIVKPLGKIKLECKVKDIITSEEFIIANVNSTPLLGLNTCVDLGLIKRLDNLGLTIQEFENKDQIVEKNNDLLRYNLNIEYLPGKLMYVADTLSRAYIKDKVEEDQTMKEVVHSVNSFVNITQNKKEEFVRETNKDLVLKEVLECVRKGWKKGKLKEYYQRKDDLHEVDNLLFYKFRLVVPSSLQKYMLGILHEGHSGIVKTKARARDSVYWLGINQDIEDYVKECSQCEIYKPANIRESLIPHEIPDKPFEKIAMDFCEWKGKNYLVVIDFMSKWIELITVRSKDTDIVIKKLKSCFATHGIPKIIIADNMPFGSYKFKKFAEEWGISIINSSPRYPQSNGLAESAVKTAKSFLKKESDVDVALMNYRNTPITKIGLSPAQIVFNRRIRTKLPVIETLLKQTTVDYKEVKDKLWRKNESMKGYYDRKYKERKEMRKDEQVLVRKGDSWEYGTIQKKVETAPRSYIVKTENGSIRRNSIHIKPTRSKPRPAVGDDQEQEGVEQERSKEEERNYCSKRVVRAPNRFRDFVMY